MYSHQEAWLWGPINNYHARLYSLHRGLFTQPDEEQINGGFQVLITHWGVTYSCVG